MDDDDIDLHYVMRSNTILLYFFSLEFDDDQYFISSFDPQTVRLCLFRPLPKRQNFL